MLSHSQDSLDIDLKKGILSTMLSVNKSEEEDVPSGKSSNVE